MPRPVHDEADIEQQLEGKKLPMKQARLQAKYPKAKIEVWSMDEHRLGIKSVQRRVWEQQAQQPIAAVKWRFQWLWLYGLVHPLVWGN